MSRMGVRRTPPTTMLPPAGSKCFTPGEFLPGHKAEMICRNSGEVTIEDLIEHGIVKEIDGQTMACNYYKEKVVHTDKWCGELAGGWGTGKVQAAKCAALDGNIIHHTPTGSVFSCGYDNSRGCVISKRASEEQVLELNETLNICSNVL